MEATTFNFQKQRDLLPKDELVELIEASDLPASARRTLIAFSEAANHQHSIPHHPKINPNWRSFLGEPP